MEASQQSVRADVFGLRGVLAKLRPGLHYPVRKRDLLDAVKDERIRWMSGEPPLRVRLKELIQAIPNRTYRDEVELAVELQAAAERLGLPPG